MPPYPSAGRAGLRLHPLLSALLALMACCAIVPGAASAATLSASPSNLASVFSSAQPGDTIQLAAGSYGSWQGGTKTGMVTLRPVAGAAVTLSTNFNGAAFITLDGISAMPSVYMGGRTHDITIKNSAVTGPSVIDASTMSGANILFDHDSFDNIDACGTCYEGRLTVRGNNNTSAVGVAITNSHFGNGGGSDGVQIVGDAYGVQIGPGNEFANIKQGNYAAHVDSIQLYGSSHTQIVGNYFHDNDTIIMAPDGGDSEYIANNVMIGSGYVPAVQLGSHQNTQVVHNTVKNIQIQTGSKVGASTGRNVNVSNNVFAQGASTSPAGGNGCTSCPVTYNLFVNSASGTNALTGTPIFVGGANPTTYAGWALAAGSPGKGNASDGTDRGINPDGSTPVDPDPPVDPPVDTTAPDTTITGGPIDTTTDTTPTFSFTSTESPSTFECKTDSDSWASCSSPFTSSTLTVGSHTFSVRATDAASNTDASPATSTFTVAAAPPADTTAPDTTITGGPIDTTTDTTPTFSFTSTESPSTFQCKRDSGSWRSCSSAYTTPTLTLGSHTFSVRATDAAGNTDASPATRTYTVQAVPPADTTAPDTTITSGPSGLTNDATPTYTFTSTEAGSTFACRIDLGSWEPCNSPYVASTLADGNHNFAVRATDLAGNTDASAAASSLTIDTVAPHTTIGSSPSAISLGSDATIVFGSEEGAAFECRLDDGVWTPCESPATFAGLTLGDHTFAIRAHDAAGNVEAPAASTTWVTVALPDPTPPATPDEPTTETPVPDVPSVPAVPDVPVVPELPAPSLPAPSIPAPAAPTLALVRPATGSTFTSKINAAATATDRDGVSRVEFWLDGNRVATDRTAPYQAAWTVSKSTSYGTHTLTARAFDRRGAVSSAAIAITRLRTTASVSTKARSRAAARAAWRLASLAIDGDATQLEGASTADDTMTVTYARCNDGSGKPIGTQKVRSDAAGKVTGTISATGACVLKVS